MTPSASCPRFSVCTASRAVRPSRGCSSFALFVEIDIVLLLLEERGAVRDERERYVTQCLLAPNMPFGVDGNQLST